MWGTRALPWIAVALAIVARVWIAVHVAGLPPVDDERSYLQLAEKLRQGQGFAYGRDNVPTAFRAPLLPVLLAACGEASRVVLVALGIGLALAGGWLTRQALPTRPAVAWGVVLALLWYPPLMVGSARLLTEVPFSLLLVLCLGWIHQTLAGGGMRTALLAGAAGGLAALARANGLPICLALAALWLMLGPHRRQVVWFALALALCLTPWTVRNYVHFQAFVPTTTMAGTTIWMGQNPPPEGFGYSNWEGIIEAQRRLGVLVDEDGRAVDELTKSRALAADARRQMLADPWRTVKLTMVKWAWLVYPYDGTTYWPRFAYNPFTGLLLFWAALGLWQARQAPVRRWPLVAVLAATVALAALTYGSPRFRHPIDPLLMVLAGWGVAWSFTLPVLVRRRLWYCVLAANLLLFVLDNRPKEWARAMTDRGARVQTTSLPVHHSCPERHAPFVGSHREACRCCCWLGCAPTRPPWSRSTTTDRCASTKSPSTDGPMSGSTTSACAFRPT